jgi:uncharacterized protein
MWSACKPSVQKTARREAPTRRRNLISLFARAAERAGSEDVWVKDVRLLRAERGGRSFSIEVIVATPARAEVLRAIRREAVVERLEARIRPVSKPPESCVSDIVIESRRRELGILRLVEVPRILQAAIVIDDLGQNLAAARELVGLRYPLTFSVMPRVRYARETAEMAHRSGLEVMLHLPMQPIPSSHASVSPHEIRAGMSRGQVERTVEEDIDDVPFVAGVNNHMGSRATTNPELMESVMTVLASRHLFFIDSRTTARTIALNVARRMGVPAFYRSVFLDDTRDVNYTLGQLRQFCEVVKRQGAALAIGHPYPTTLAALARFLPEFDREEIRLVPASKLARSPEFASLYPPGHRQL